MIVPSTCFLEPLFIQSPLQLVQTKGLPFRITSRTPWHVCIRNYSKLAALLTAITFTSRQFVRSNEGVSLSGPHNNNKNALILHRPPLKHLLTFILGSLLRRWMHPMMECEPCCRNVPLKIVSCITVFFFVLFFCLSPAERNHHVGKQEVSEIFFDRLFLNENSGILHLESHFWFV